MSNAYVKKYEREYHDGRQAPVSDDLPRKSSKSHKRVKPFKIETRWTLFDKDAPWHTHNRYRTAEARDQALRKLQRERIKEYNGRTWGSSIEYR